jgi:polyhydroxybutyrate depolymerase
MPHVSRSAARAIALAALLIIPSTASAQPSTARGERGRLRVGGVERGYRVDLPPGYDGRRALPLVLVFHGGGGNGEIVRRQTGMSELAAREGFIAVYPDGSGRFGNRLLTWNAGSCCGYAQARRIDEIAFVRALLDTLQARYRVDPARIYAAGHSNGGMMAYMAGCALGDRIAAIAVVSGELTVEECRPPRPVSVLVIHGTADEHLPFGGGVGPAALARHDARSVAYAVDRWRRIDGCAARPAVETRGAVVHTRYAPCGGGSAVELYAIQGGGHAWPGGQRAARFMDAPSTALAATPLIWSFFAAHPAR